MRSPDSTTPFKIAPWAVSESTRAQYLRARSAHFEGSREDVAVAVYVSLPQIPLALRFEDPFDEVVERFRELIDNGTVCRFEHGAGTAVLVNFAVQASAILAEGHSLTAPDDIHKAIPVDLPPAP